MRFVFVLLAAVVAAAVVPNWLQANFLQGNQGTAEKAAEIRYSPARSKILKVKADRRGQFTVALSLNGVKSNALIDTGATALVLPKSLALRVGVLSSGAKFTHKVETANGVTKAALVTVARLELGALRLRKVRAFVLPDDALSTPLVGMSVLEHFEEAAMKDGVLLLTAH